MCCGVFGNEQVLREYLLAIHEGELRCADCDHYCSDIEKSCPNCGGCLQLPIPDFLMPSQSDFEIFGDGKISS